MTIKAKTYPLTYYVNHATVLIYFIFYERYFEYMFHKRRWRRNIQIETAGDSSSPAVFLVDKMKGKNANVKWLDKYRGFLVKMPSAYELVAWSRKCYEIFHHNICAMQFQKTYSGG